MQKPHMVRLPLKFENCSSELIQALGGLVSFVCTVPGFSLFARLVGRFDRLSADVFDEGGIGMVHDSSRMLVYVLHRIDFAIVADV